MHGSVRIELENLLAAKPSAAVRSVANHVSRCGECASEFDAMRMQGQMLKTLRAPATIEPSGGFYARVMQRIEESAKRSIWWVFVYSPIGKRVAYASLGLSLALGSYVVAAESNDGHLSSRTLKQEATQRDATERKATLATSHYDAIVEGSADEQRSAVLENFVSHPAMQEMVSEHTVTIQ